MKKVSFFILLLTIKFGLLYSQVAISKDNSQADNSAMLEVKSTTKGFLIPRLTTAERNAIASPAVGLMIYNTDAKTWNVYNGTSWGLMSPLVCGQPFTDGRNGKAYNTVKIGTQCWMADNLNIGTRINGVNNPVNDGVIQKYCYNDDELNCDVYGGLYQWGEMMNYAASSSANPSGRQGICPPDWHLPSDAEWCQMETTLDATVNCSASGWRGTNAGGQMKEGGLSHWTAPNTGGSNASGFTALPGGYRLNGGGFYDQPNTGYFWSATQSDPSNMWSQALSYFKATVNRSANPMTDGFSVRCVKD